MSARNVDKHNRFRCITVGFRVSPEEHEHINKAVAMSGLSKQEYCYRRCLGRDIVVQGNPRVYKALKDQLAEVLVELKRIDNEILLPENAPVRLTSAQLEGLDYTKLYRAYSVKGRKSKVDPRVLFKVMVYGYQCGIYSSRKLEEACRYRVDFMWLLGEQPVPDHTTISGFRTGRCADAAEDLFYQYVNLLEQQGETDHETVFVDGTKIESSAGRYTFCWRGSVEKRLAKVREKVLATAGLQSLTALQEYLKQREDGIVFVFGKGGRKSEEQRQRETLDELRQNGKDTKDP